jgi:FixJ family two-component response regulator
LFVVDDDAASRDDVLALASEMGLGAAAFESIDAFQKGCPDEPGCVIADLHLAASNSVDWQNVVRGWTMRLPVIFLACKPATSLVVQAMKAGALSVVDKPCSNGEVEQAVRQGLAIAEGRWTERQKNADFQSRLATLSENERVVLDMIVAGKANKTMAAQLGASLRTVENRRRSIFTKLGMHTVAELVTAVLRADGDATLR